MIFNNTFKNLGRTREIIGILIKYGFEDIIANSTLRNFVPEGRRLKWLRQERPVMDYTRWERIRMCAEELGPTFVKLGQILSNRPDMLPEPLIKELEKLQDNVPPFEFEKAKLIIERDIGKPLDEFFREFNEKPLASASIGQVHKARLRTGEEVVVKVQRPGVRETVLRDLSILKEAVNRADRYLQKQGVINAGDVVRAFERTMTKELDYRNEARNIEKFRATYKDYHNFYVPKAYREYSTEKILLIEFCPGCKITDVKQIKKWGIDPLKIVELGMEIYLTQIFEFGYFHADPHPGNVMVRKDGTICLLDFGMVGQMMRRDKFAFAWVFISLAQQDAKKMAENMRKLAIEDDIQDMRQFEYDLQELIEDYASLDVSEGSIADMTTALQKVMYDYKMRVPGGIFLIFRAFAILEGIGKIMHPHFNTYEFIKPYGLRIIKEQYSAKNLLTDLTDKGSQLAGFINNFPAEIKSILQQARKGKIHFEVEHQGYGYLLKKMDSLTNRIILTLVIVALVIGSAITMTMEQTADLQTYKGIPSISIAGLSTAGFLCLILMYATLRRRVYK